VNTGVQGGTFNLSGSGNLTVGSGSGLYIGRSDNAGTANNTTNLFNQTGGTASVSTLAMGGKTGGSTGVSSTLTLTGGTFSAGTFSVLAAGNTNTAVINIGGTADVTLPALPTARGTSSTATLNFDGGTLRPAAASTTYISGLTNAFILDGGAKIDVASGNDITITQNLLTDVSSTGGGLTKDGVGSLTLTGTNTYTGVTAVSAGKLVVNGNISTSSLTTVAATAALGGTGTVGAVTISGILAPGNSIGTITSIGDVTWNDNDAWVFELGTSASTLALANSGSSIQDMLNITGIGSDFLKGSGSSFTFDFANTGAVGFYKLVDWAGTSNFSSSDFVATNLTSGLTGTFTVDGGTSALYLNVVPEPRAALIGGLGLLALLRRRRE
jgi:autotransporter-associated beta strand protein